MFNLFFATFTIILNKFYGKFFSRDSYEIITKLMVKKQLSLECLVKR